MKSNQLLKGVGMVALGASSYGMLATFVKLAYQEGYTTSDVGFSQLSIGLIVMLLLTHISERQNPEKTVVVRGNDGYKLLVLGTSLGLTTLFYYIAVKYINVSVAIVLLMQTTWMSVILEALLTRTFPNIQKVGAVILVLVGTVFSTNIIGTEVAIDPKGLFFGFLAAMSFTATMYASNRVATYLPAYKKSSIMLTGGFTVILIFCYFAAEGGIQFSIFQKWGIVLALFGTIIPPLAFNVGFPKTGLGLGSIVSSLELPVSILMAAVLLQEQIVTLQIVGIVLILIAVVLMNYRFAAISK